MLQEISFEQEITKVFAKRTKKAAKLNTIVFAARKLTKTHDFKSCLYA